MSLKIEEKEGYISVGVSDDDVEEFESLMDEAGVFFELEGGDDEYVWYSVDPEGLPLLKKWNDISEGDEG